MVAGLIQKYVWLIQTFTDAQERGLTLEELQDKWEENFGAALARSSFVNHRKAIEDIFGISILCDRSTNRYYLPFADDAIDMDSSQRWLVNTFTVSNMLSLGRERLSGRVSVEDIPSGHKFLPTVMDAMLKSSTLEIEYGKYTQDMTSTRHVHPYAVKEYAKRWYLVGYSEERDSVRVYSLDRIRRAALTGTSFKLPKGFDVDQLFENSFGIYIPSPDQTPVTIRFQADGIDAGYLRDLPLHRSQREIDPQNHIFRMKVVPTPDLYMQLCSFAGRIRILSPDAVRENMLALLEKGCAMNGNNNENKDTYEKINSSDDSSSDHGYGMQE